MIAAGAAAALAEGTHTASAAQPSFQGCPGQDISGYARSGNTVWCFTFESGAGFGGVFSTVARLPEGADGRVGLGGEISLHQAGLIPDAIIGNSCN